jgi:hypothetical protein
VPRPRCMSAWIRTRPVVRGWMAMGSMDGEPRRCRGAAVVPAAQLPAAAVCAVRSSCLTMPRL